MNKQRMISIFGGTLFLLIVMLFSFQLLFDQKFNFFSEVDINDKNIVHSKNFLISNLAGTSCSDPNLLPQNIKSGVTICDVTGTYVVSGGLVDNDNDGYVSNSSLSNIILFLQTFYSVNTDCDDNNVSINDATDNTCDGDGDGYIDSTAGGLDEYDNNPSLFTLPQNCNDWFLGGSNTNGIYSIDPDGLGANPTFNAYCDMTTDGGGWTLVLRALDTSQAHQSVSAVGTLTAPNQVTVAKLSDTSIDLIRGNKSETVIRMTFDDAINPVYWRQDRVFVGTPSTPPINICFPTYADASNLNNAGFTGGTYTASVDGYNPNCGSAKPLLSFSTYNGFLTQLAPQPRSGALWIK